MVDKKQFMRLQSVEIDGSPDAAGLRASIETSKSKEKILTTITSGDEDKSIKAAPIHKAKTLAPGKKKIRKNYVGKPSTASEVEASRKKFRASQHRQNKGEAVTMPVMKEPGTEKKYMSKKERLAKKEEERRLRL
jgi:hypothetical protein